MYASGSLGLACGDVSRRARPAMAPTSRSSARRRAPIRIHRYAKRDQWNADTAIDWSREVDPAHDIVDPDRFALKSTRLWTRLSRAGLASSPRPRCSPISS